MYCSFWGAFRILFHKILMRGFFFETSFQKINNIFRVDKMGRNRVGSGFLGGYPIPMEKWGGQGLVQGVLFHREGQNGGHFSFPIGFYPGIPRDPFFWHSGPGSPETPEIGVPDPRTRFPTPTCPLF